MYKILKKRIIQLLDIWGMYTFRWYTEMPAEK